MGGYNSSTETDISMLLYTSSALLKLFHLGFEKLKSEVKIKTRDSESGSLECCRYFLRHPPQERDFFFPSSFYFFFFFRKGAEAIGGKRKKYSSI